MQIVGIILARTDSARLPGKVLLDLGEGRRMIDLVAERARRAGRVSALALATTDRAVDDELARHAGDELGLIVYRGGTEDVATRALHCAETYGAEWFVRLNGDSPFVDPGLIDQGIALAEASGADLVTNLLPRTYPYGVAVEVLRTQACRRVIDEFDAANQEHVSQFFYRHPERFRIEPLGPSVDPTMSEVRLTVDDAADLRRIRDIVLRLGPEAGSAGYERIVSIWRQLEEIAKSEARQD